MRETEKEVQSEKTHKRRKKKRMKLREEKLQENEQSIQFVTLNNTLPFAEFQV